MKITLVISSLTELPGGGAKRVITNMANYWADSEHEVTLITFDNDQFGLMYLSHIIERVGSTGQLRKLKQLI
tara:strand:- start:2 stop:217 length:216 start_codon:yes stop_codon:yes gene_type:complete